MAEFDSPAAPAPGWPVTVGPDQDRGAGTDPRASAARGQVAGSRRPAEHGELCTEQVGIVPAIPTC